ncbi:uncharacterized protein BP01DRAFT_381476 [Aspergillus saccharolyticus JOP 1030-1]|uniref:Uncharacterized protein n=1 Tax=Aspergillus saccharolyticus JOP 1030-1 TaxID=1450539 RepID=A0A318ZG39_9EURO|nr:hypothetical protein BP01DRAFT_381476 [Aspergillus saccharolyticus JOP 1030-1]PYH46419.1 hypothetical protein BP01DRAFT_381476 [Aspergillus saccharolyticus JOP 1030-1]
MCADRTPSPHEDDDSIIEPDDFDDNDSTYPDSLDDASYTSSLASSAMNYAYEVFLGFPNPIAASSSLTNFASPSERSQISFLP